MDVFRRLIGLEVLEPRWAFDRGGGSLNTFDKNAVADAFFAEYQSAIVPTSSWTGDIANCVAGSNNQQFNDATLKMLNYFRNMAGLPSATLDPDKNAKAFAAALMMDAQNSLSHSPGRDWACYSSVGADAAAHSNLYLGRSGAQAMAGYVEDPGASNAAVGHRRWVLYPPQASFGVGSTDRANALWVIGNPGIRPSTPETVTWPPSGYVPYQVVYPRWSFSLNRAQQQSIDFGSAQVRMWANSQEIALDVVARSNEGYGDRALVWEPVGLRFSNGMEDQVVHVEVKNVLVGGVSTNFSYDVTVFDAARPWQNLSNPLDINADGNVAPIDALFIINLLNTRSILDSLGTLPPVREPTSDPRYYDVNGDSYCSAVDVLLIVNEINRQSNSPANAEGKMASIQCPVFDNSSELEHGDEATPRRSPFEDDLGIACQDMESQFNDVEAVLDTISGDIWWHRRGRRY